MEDPGRLGFQHWTIDHNHLHEHLRDHPALKLMNVISERDAAILERNTAIADKKTAFAERDAALLQRDVAYADRNSALMERDAAVAALAMVRADTDLRQGNATEAASKLMHMVNMAVGCPFIDSDLQPVPKGNAELSNSLDGKQSRKQKKRVRKVPKDNPRKRKTPSQMSQEPKGSKSLSKKRQKLKQLTSLEKIEKLEKPKQDEREKCTDLVVYNCAAFSIPYCSCTGINQQCYRWGNGGWQSACCTNFISTYPLPMNPKKRSSRIPGRKMSGGAFKKLLERLAAEGVNISCPVDLKSHWAKHGTNRYVTIK